MKNQIIVRFGEICLLSDPSSLWELLSVQYSVHTLSGKAAAGAGIQGYRWQQIHFLSCAVQQWLALKGDVPSWF